MRWIISALAFWALSSHLAAFPLKAKLFGCESQGSCRFQISGAVSVEGVREVRVFDGEKLAFRSADFHVIRANKRKATMMLRARGQWFIRPEQRRRLGQQGRSFGVNLVPDFRQQPIVKATGSAHPTNHQTQTRSAQSRVTKPIETSADYRKDSRGFILAGVSPLSTLIIPAYTLDFGTFIERDQALEVHFARGAIDLHTAMELAGMDTSLNLPQSAHLMGDEDQVAQAETEANRAYRDAQRLEIFHQTLSLRLKTFWGNSFYSNVGIGERKVGFSYDLEQISDYDGLTTEFSAERYGLDLGLGNRWQWSNATLGVDWVSAFVPWDFVSGGSSEDSTPAEQFNKYASMPSLAILQLQLGFVF